MLVEKYLENCHMIIAQKWDRKVSELMSASSATDREECTLNCDCGLHEAVPMRWMTVTKSHHKCDASPWQDLQAEQVKGWQSLGERGSTLYVKSYLSWQGRNDMTAVGQCPLTAQTSRGHLQAFKMQKTAMAGPQRRKIIAQNEKCCLLVDRHCAWSTGWR